MERDGWRELNEVRGEKKERRQRASKQTKHHGHVDSTPQRHILLCTATYTSTSSILHLLLCTSFLLLSSCVATTLSLHKGRHVGSVELAEVMSRQ